MTQREDLIARISAQILCTELAKRDPIKNEESLLTTMPQELALIFTRMATFLVDQCIENKSAMVTPRPPALPVSGPGVLRKPGPGF